MRNQKAVEVDITFNPDSVTIRGDLIQAIQSTAKRLDRVPGEILAEAIAEKCGVAIANEIVTFELPTEMADTSRDKIVGLLRAKKGGAR